MENPLSESALEHGMVNKLVMSRYKSGNRYSPSAVLTLPTADQNGPVHGLDDPSTPRY